MTTSLPQSLRAVADTFEALGELPDLYVVFSHGELVAVQVPESLPLSAVDRILLVDKLAAAFNAGKCGFHGRLDDDGTRSYRTPLGDSLSIYASGIKASEATA